MLHAARRSPYYKEPLHVLRRCHESVLGQQGDATHSMVADRLPTADVDSWKSVVHIKIPNHADYGDTPRGVGAACAAANGFDAICFLDADNWYEPNHIGTMRTIVQITCAQIVTAARTISSRRPRAWHLQGIQRDRFQRHYCYFLTRAVFPACAVWLFKDSSESIVGDRFSGMLCKPVALSERAQPCQLSTT